MADDNAILGPDGRMIQLGWMDDIIDFKLPHGGFAVLHYSGTVSSSKVTATTTTGVLDTWPYGATILKPALLAGKFMENSIEVLKKKKLVAKSFEPWRKQTFFSTTGSTTYDYQSATVVAGLKGAPFAVRNSAVGHGVHSDETFINGQAQILTGWEQEFGWDTQTAIEHIGFMLFYYDFLVQIGSAPLNDNPTNWDPSAVVTVHPVLDEQMEVHKQQAVVLDLNGIKDPKQKTVTIQVRAEGSGQDRGRQGHYVTLWTYKKKPKDWDINDLNLGQWDLFSNSVQDATSGLSGEGFFEQRNVSTGAVNTDIAGSYAGNNFEPFRDDGITFQLPDEATDYRAVSGLDNSEDIQVGAFQPTITVTFVVNLKTMQIISATRSA